MIGSLHRLVITPITAEEIVVRDQVDPDLELPILSSITILMFWKNFVKFLLLLLLKLLLITI